MDGTPNAVKTRVSKDQDATLKTKLETEGATIEMK